MKQMGEQDESRLRRNLDSTMHANINQRQYDRNTAKSDSGVKWEHWLYEGKRMIDELRRLPILFQREREGTLPQAFKYCSLSPTEKLPVENELICCLGEKTKECPILRDAFKDTGAFPLEMIDHAKAHICVAHVLSEKFGPHAIDTSEGYITDSTERAFWQRTYEYMAMEPPEPECEECGEPMTDEDIDDSGKVGTVMRCRKCLVKVDRTLAT
jgi:hypothetical protein